MKNVLSRINIKLTLAMQKASLDYSNEALRNWKPNK